MTATTVRPIPAPRPHVAERPASFQDPTYQAFWLLRIGFIVAPILFGIDKFAHVLVDWDKYLAPEFTDLFNAQAHTLMYAVGAIEIVAGLVVALPSPLRRLPRRRVAGRDHHQPLLIGDYYDIALRDFGLLLAALTLARLATVFPAGLPARRRV